MFCSECGLKSPEPVKFCWNCGKAVLNIDSTKLNSLDSKVSKNITHSPGVEGADINVNDDIPNEIHPNPKDVDEQLQHAGFWLRAFVFLIDTVPIIVPYAVWLTIAKDENLSTGLSSNQELFCLWLLFFMYDTISNYKYGGTFAKRWFGLKVCRLNKLDNLSFKQCVYRFISSTLFVHLGYLSQPFTKNRQALHDKVAGSVVVCIDTKKHFGTGVVIFVASIKLVIAWFAINFALVNMIFPDIFKP